MDLKEFFKKLGTAIQDEDFAKDLESFGITTEQIEEFKKQDLDIPTTLDEAIEKNKEIKREFSRRLNQAADTRESKLKLKYGFGDEEKEDEEDDQQNDVDVKDPAMKALLKKLNEMGNEISTLKQERANETLEQKKTRAKEFLKSKGILPGYVHELDLDKDFEEQFESVKQKYEADGGTLITENHKKTGQKLPFPSKPDAKNQPSKEEVEAFKSKI